MDVLERDFEEWVCRNIEAVCGRGFQLIGRQVRVVSGGFIDVLAIHRNDEYAHTNLCVVELKRDQITDAAVSQILTYMGALQESVDQANAQHRGEYFSVCGVLAAPSISASASYAVNAVESLTFTQLKVNFSANRWPGIYIKPTADDAKETVAQAIAAFIPKEESAATVVDREPDDGVGGGEE